MTASGDAVKAGGALGRKLTAAERTVLAEALRDKVRETLAGEEHPAEDMLPEYLLTMVDNRRTKKFVTDELAPLLADGDPAMSVTLVEFLWERLGQLLTGTEGAEASAEAAVAEAAAAKSAREESATSSGRKATASGVGTRKRARATAAGREKEEPAPAAVSTAEADARRLIEEARETRTAQHHGGQRAAAKRAPRHVPAKRTAAADHADDSAAPAADAGTNGDAASASRKEAAGEEVPKCQFWPNCKHGDQCRFFHPTEPCIYYPNCRAGDRCRYIHPDAGRGMPTQLLMMQKMMQMHTQGMMAPPCKYGYACERRRQNKPCSFSHPQITCRYGKNCKRQPRGGMPGMPGTCMFSHAPLCRNGWECSRPGCAFAHPAKAPDVAEADATTEGGDPATAVADTPEHMESELGAEAQAQVDE
ncbi:hypothetical protein CDCA_CDCA07G2242 [Cyanidium caldarium]|uniref:C3H1-type domain-containing protein n=1 Tax=Cyanidium caldarium TaxID=2771 RepID=A0AAV9IV54_CYACA|nr:hypothetical protein CDCA_CDCA07G2242 [Cyanidium caldarium]